ncbi:MAG: restriction endonuclease subunit S [Methanobrevibacter sp.]|uniref:restriction endonuclease subunit S n=1 Tax=Methanobrevibacter sp. TaxID=66852 RepID=UPI0025F93DDB|nr:restriction endonuclease subunit S [Methanobrevibacter sp.]MBR0272157.1 restriction endonuclease subunit S [Methanobrevibacter sp.]
MTEKNVPKLRFSGFNETWVKSNLGNVSSDEMYGMNSAATDFDGFNKYIRITDISESSNKFVPSPLTSPDGNLDEKFKLKEGDIVFARTGASTGKTYIYDKNDGNLYFAGFLIKFNINKAYPKFVFYNTLKDEYKNWVSVMSVRSGQPGINSNEYKKLPLNIPSLDEQKKISDFLESIDSKINLLKKKYEYYQEFKKYLMQQIFAGKLRFDFDDEWKQYKLKDLLTVKSSSISINQLEDNTGEYPLYGASGFLKNIDFCEMETDYISIVKDGSGVGNLSYHEKNSSIVNTSQYLLPKKDFNIHFLYYQLQTLNLLKYVNGSSIPHIYFKDYCIEKVTVPSLPEQQKIGKLFVDTDKTIENIDNCIQVTQEFKKGLLQQMFV